MLYFHYTKTKAPKQWKMSTKQDVYLHLKSVSLFQTMWTAFHRKHRKFIIYTSSYQFNECAKPTHYKITCTSYKQPSTQQISNTREVNQGGIRSGLCSPETPNLTELQNLLMTHYSNTSCTTPIMSCTTSSLNGTNLYITSDQDITISN